MEMLITDLKRQRRRRRPFLCLRLPVHFSSGAGRWARRRLGPARAKAKRWLEPAAAAAAARHFGGPRSLVSKLRRLARVTTRCGHQPQQAINFIEHEPARRPSSPLAASFCPLRAR